MQFGVLEDKNEEVHVHGEPKNCRERCNGCLQEAQSIWDSQKKRGRVGGRPQVKLDAELSLLASVAITALGVVISLTN